MTDDAVGPTIPHSREAEEAVIGAVLINPDVFPDVVQFLCADDFYIHRHRWLWESFGDLHKNKIPIDLITINEELERNGKLSEIGGPAYITSLISATPTSLNAESYGHIIEGHSIRRKMINAANAIASAAYDESSDITKVTSLMWKEVEGVSIKAEPRGLKNISTFMGGIYDHVDKWSQTDDLPGVPTGFIDLDHILGNLQDDDLTILAARPGQGKTALLTDIAFYNGLPPTKNLPMRQVAIFSLEMSNEGVAYRIITKHSGIDSQRLRSGKLLEKEWPIFAHTIEVLENTGIYIDDTPSISVKQMLAKSKQMKARDGLDLIIVDYIQLAQGEGDNRTQEVGSVSRGLKLLAKELHVPVIAAAQMSRAVERRSTQRPILSDLRESGSLEQDADNVLFLYRTEAKDKNNITEVIVAKQRNGPLGSIELVFRPSLAKYESAATKMFKPVAAPVVEPAWMQQDNTGGGSED